MARRANKIVDLKDEKMRSTGEGNARQKLCNKVWKYIERQHKIWNDTKMYITA